MFGEMKNKVKQTVIPEKVIEMAKFIQECDQKKQPFTILKRRQWGLTAAMNLARNNN